MNTSSSSIASQGVPRLLPFTPFEAIDSDFKLVYSHVRSADNFYRFLQNIYRLYPEDRFHTLIKEQTELLPNDEAIYRSIQLSLPSIKPTLGDLTYALPALAKQKKEIARQTLQLLKGRSKVSGYVEIGSTGRYISQLRKEFPVHGQITLINDVAPGYSPVDIVERGGLTKIGQCLALANYEPITGLAADEADLVTCYIGLHHCPLEKLEPFIDSAVQALRNGGLFILRDHDVKSAEMNAFVGLAHTVFNAGLNAPWSDNANELRFFRSVDDWIALLAAFGLKFTEQRILQEHDPSDNVLMAFEKV
jgi:SAM-dependent methyltransferase